MYLYIKALHIIFVVTWFAGLFYMPRLLIYNAEAQEKPEAERLVLSRQFGPMMKRLWYGITCPSAILTWILGPTLLYQSGWLPLLFTAPLRWLLFKLIFVLLLLGYHFSLQYLMKQQLKGNFSFSAQKLRMWNEVATIFLFAIVFLVVVKQSMSLVWGLGGLILLILALMIAIKIYKNLRNK